MVGRLWGAVIAGMALVQVLGMAADSGWRRPFVVLGQDQGLPPGGVLCITQDRDGFIWLGTEGGLVRYEGGRSRRWTREDGLPSSYVAQLFPDPEGGVWGLTLEGLVRFRGGRIEVAHPVGQPGGRIAGGSLAQDRDGRLWISGTAGLLRQREGLGFEPVDRPHTPGAQALVAGAASGALYLYAPGWIEALHPDGTVQRWGPSEGVPKESLTLLVEDGAGRLWVGSGRTLRMKEAQGNRFTDQSARLTASLSPNGQAFLDTDGAIWVPTRAGLSRLLGNETESLDTAGGLPFPWARSAFRDREGTLWVLGPALARLQGGGKVWNHPIRRASLGEVVWSITRDAQGRILAGTDDGVVRLDPEGPRTIPGTEGRRIKGMVLDRGGDLWMVSTIGAPLLLPKGALAACPAPFGGPGASFNRILEDPEGRLWLGHGTEGVVRWDPAAGRLKSEQSPADRGVKALGVFGLAHDAQGRIWAASTRGLLVRDQEGRWTGFHKDHGLRGDRVRAVALLPDGTAWLAYHEPLGLTRVRVEGGRLEVLEHRGPGPGLRSDLVYALDVDPRGQVWVTTDRGLGRLDPPWSLGRHDGMLSEDCSVLALMAEADRVWVGTAGGLVRVEGTRAQPPGLPRAHVLEVATGGGPFRPVGEGLAPVPHREATLQLRVGSTTYLAEEALRFQVRLLGLEERWRDLDGRVATFPALPGGHYRFQVRAARGDGGFGSVAELAFAVRPPWWRTWWAWGLWILGGTGAVLGLVRLRVARLARSRDHLERLVAQRTAELSQRNAELSQALGEVKQLSGLLPICAHCKKIRDDGGYWNQLEAYITDHSGAGFSHGICPECADQYFPEVRRRRDPAPPHQGDDATMGGPGSPGA